MSLSILCQGIVAVAVLLSRSFASPLNTKRAGACTVSSFSEVPGCLSSQSITISDLQVPAGETLSLQKLQSGTTVTFTGTTTFAYEEWEGPLVAVSGDSVTIQGDGVLDGQGAGYWDGKGSNGGSTKPKFFSAHALNNAIIKDIILRNTPVQAFSIQSDNLTIDNVKVDDSAGTANGHNTDGFDIGSSTGVTISNCVVNNQDDCVAINSGENISVSNMTCIGGHGLSVGSVGGRTDNDVSNVSFRSSTVANSQNGLRIKTVSGATGSVKNVTWQEIGLQDITSYGVVIEQDYENGGPSGKATNGVVIDGVTASNISGTMKGGNSAKEVYVLCGSSCTDFNFNEVAITGGSKGSVNGVEIPGFS